MQKVTVELFKVHKYFKVKFSLITKDDNPNGFNRKLIDKFNFKGNEYVKINPFPFITIDITNKMDKNEEWSSNQAFNMNRRELFMFLSKVKKLLKNFIQEKELFYYNQNQELIVNSEISQKIKEVCVCGNKTILLQPCVVFNDEDKQQYEGIFLSINSIDYFSYLTYMELHFLYEELIKLDMSSLTMQVINTTLLTEQVEARKSEIKIPVITEKEEESIVDKKVIATIPEPDTIPDI